MKKEIEVDFLSEKELMSLLTSEERGFAQKISNWKILLNREIKKLVDWKNIKDPIRLQLIPQKEELEEKGIPDFSQENKFKILPWLIHRYPDRVVILCSTKCFAHCRFCFRRSLEKQNLKFEEEELEKTFRYLKQKPEVKEIILSGGDALFLSNQWLQQIIKKFSQLKQIISIRISSRALCFYPPRIDEELIEILSSSEKQIWFIAHFNHPKEIQDASQKAIKKLIKAGVPILNQTVLLKGINDQAQILKELFYKLVSLGVKPYYLFQCDPILGAVHFSLELDKALKLWQELSFTSGLALPKFSLELPDYGKISLDEGWKIEKALLGWWLISPIGKKYFYPSSQSIDRLEV